jgi:hypothetical protein
MLEWPLITTALPRLPIKTNIPMVAKIRRIYSSCVEPFLCTQRPYILWAGPVVHDPFLATCI